jgi:hypothetical protein
MPRPVPPIDLRANWQRSFALLLGSWPIVVALYVQVTHWVNIPIWDEWDTPGIAILHWAQHRLTWADLFAQQNEHRQVFPRLLSILLFSLSGWDVRQTMLLAFVGFCNASAFCLYFLCRSIRSTIAPLVGWIAVNFLLFAPSQYENLLSGLAFGSTIPPLCLLAAVATNLSDFRFPFKVGLNCVWALIASYTFAHGMLLWFLALPIPSEAERSHSKRRLSLVIWYVLYVAVATFSIACYFIGYKRPPVAPEPAKLSQLPQAVEFFFVWLGAVVRSPPVNVRLAGVIVAVTSICAIIATLLTLLRNERRWNAYYPWLLLAVFASLSGLITARGRVNLGTNLVFNEANFNGFSGVRYNGTSVFAYVASVGLLVNLYSDFFDRSKRRYFSSALIVLATLFAVSWIYMFSNESIRVRTFTRNRAKARLAVIWSRALPNNPDLFAAYPYLAAFPKRVEEMRHFGVLRLPEVSKRLVRTIRKAPTTTDFRSGHIDVSASVLRGRLYRIKGWARNPERNSCTDLVIVGWQQREGSFHPFTIISTGRSRPDVTQAFNSPSLSNCGFDEEIDVSRLPKRDIELKAWAVDFRGQEAFPIEGTACLYPSAP